MGVEYMIEDLLKYSEVFGKAPTFKDDEHIIHEGKIYPYEITLSSEYSDDMCMRVLIDGTYYYFG